MNGAQDAVSRYGAVAIGLLLGLLAKYGLALTDGHTPTWRGLLADLLLLGMLGLLAIIASDWLGLTGNMKVLAGAMVAVSSDRTVRAVRKRFEQWSAAQLEARMPLTSVSPPAPAVSTPPREVVREMIGGPLPAPNPEHDALIAKMDEDRPA